ncbi:protein-L-isoaspartate O-methyltransferase, partial [Sulfurivirga sp.]|uniref:protein-L-isoaspartate O-methyltransferase family protein n=1 Tax=Sulfurivirga sp. TaxID=2614236 RepID=UPI00345BE06B
MDFDRARFNMVEQQIRPWDVLDPKVLQLFLDTPRHLFAPEEHRDLAYMDLEVPLPHDQVMLAP